MTMLQYPGHVVAIALLCILGALVAWAFHVPRWRQLRLLRVTVPVLQLAPLAMLLFLIWDPARSQRKPEAQPNTVLTILDTSESMSAGATPGITNLDVAVDVFERTFAPDAPDSPVYEYLGFDGTLHKAPSLRSLPRWGAQSSIAPVLEALQMASRTGAGDAGPATVGAIVFTDGQMLEENAAALPVLEADGFKMIIVGVGPDEPSADLRVDRIDVAPRVRLDSRATATITLSGSGLAEQTVHLELAVDGLPLATRSVDGVNEDGVTVTIPIPTDSRGIHTVEARATMEEPEAFVANNVGRGAYEAVPEPALQVLFYSQWANFDIGKMRQVLEREQKVSLEFHLDAFMDDGRRQWVRGGRSRGAPGPHLASKDEPEFPSDQEVLNAYDIVVLGPCDPTSFSKAQTEALYRFVSERGGGLLLFPGEGEFDLAHSYDSQMNAIFPAACRPGSSDDSQPLSDIAITAEGRGLGLAPLEEIEDFQVHLNLCYDLEKKPAASPVVTLGGQPAIVSHRVGRGHVALLNLRHLYRLYREDLEGGPLRQLVSDLVTHLGAVEHDASFVQLLAERTADNPHRIAFTARVLDTDYAPAPGATVLLTVDDTVTRMEGTGTGEYRAAVSTPGYETVIARAEASLEGVYVGEATIAARLPLPPGELNRLGRNRAFLTALADRIGADYVDLEDLDASFAQHFPATTEFDRVTSMESAWRNWPCFLLLCTLLTAGWFVRRMVGFV